MTREKLIGKCPIRCRSLCRLSFQEMFTLSLSSSTTHFVKMKHALRWSEVKRKSQSSGQAWETNSLSASHAMSRSFPMAMFNGSCWHIPSVKGENPQGQSLDKFSIPEVPKSTDTSFCVWRGKNKLTCS